jgi:hypothetical protein
VREVGALRADAVERHEQFGVAGKYAAEFIDGAPCDVANRASLRFVEAARANDRVDLRDWQLGDRAGRGRASKQLQRDRQRHLVARANRDDACDELLEERAMPALGELEHRGVGE